MYLCNPTTGTAPYMASGVLGFIDTPAQGNKRPDGITWCLDNGAFSDNWDADLWWRYAVKNAPYADTCLFAVAPDVVGDHEATLERSRPWLPKLRQLGYKAAFVVQDGATPDTVPWDDFDVLFIGGARTENPRDEWKLSAAARRLVGAAKQRGMWVHCGRVNSAKRYAWAAAVGCDSCDGTYVTRGPDLNLPDVLHWVNTFKSQPPLFNLEAS